MEDNKELIAIMGSDGMIVVKGQNAPVGFLYKTKEGYSMDIIPGANMTVKEIMNLDNSPDGDRAAEV